MVVVRGHGNPGIMIIQELPCDFIHALEHFAANFMKLYQEKRSKALIASVRWIFEKLSDYNSTSLKHIF